MSAGIRVYLLLTCAVLAGTWAVYLYVSKRCTAWLFILGQLAGELIRNGQAKNFGVGAYLI